MERVLQDAKLEAEDVDEVVLVGLATKIPKIVKDFRVGLNVTQSN